jgi:sugar/nucleoside kinase (ribokinase family)
VFGSNFLIAGGGCAANAALAVARLGGRAAFAGPRGEASDTVSNRIVADLVAALRFAAAVSAIRCTRFGDGGAPARASRRCGVALSPLDIRTFFYIDSIQTVLQNYSSTAGRCNS